MSITASIVIPTLLFEPKYLDNCLDSLAKQQFSETFEVIIVVNDYPNYLGKKLVFNKKEKVEEIIKKYKSKLKVKSIYKDTNTGFAGATNAGIHAATGKYILTLNDDTVVTKHWISRIIQKAQNEQLDMVASTIYSPQLARDVSPQSIDSISKQKEKNWKIDSLGFIYQMKGKALPITAFVDLQKTKPFGPDAAAALYSRKLIETVTDSHGVFDERFFAYLEDVDLAYRAQKAGFSCGVSEDAVVYHFKHATSSGMSGFKTKQDLKNWWRLVIKNYGMYEWLWYGISILLERGRNFNGFLKSYF